MVKQSKSEIDQFSMEAFGYKSAMCEIDGFTIKIGPKFKKLT